MSSEEFDYRSYYDEHFEGATNIGRQSVLTRGYHLVPMGTTPPDPSTLYGMVAETSGKLPGFKVDGEIQLANIHPNQVERNRQPGREIRVDRYQLVLRMESTEYQKMVSNIDAIVNYRQEKKEELKQIVQSKGLFSNDDIDTEGVDIIFGGFISSATVLSFVKNVASPRPLRRESMVYCFLPSTAEQSVMRKPTSFHWRPKTPVFDDSFQTVDVCTTSILDEGATVYFQINQTYFGGKVRLIPELVGVSVKAEGQETPKNKARKSILF